MQQDHSQQANFEDEQTSNGGAAPEHRRCQYTKADGKGCRDWAIRGQELCYRHGVFLRASRGIDVPLLEDEASIVLVLSQTLRAVALGTIALKSGSLLLEGCRLAHTMHMEKQKAANAERTRRRTEVREQAMREEISEEQQETDEQQETEVASQETDAGSPGPNQECGARSPEPGAPSSEPGARSPEPCAPPPEPCALSPQPCGDRFSPRYQETREVFLAAQAEPLDERMEEESLAAGVS